MGRPYVGNMQISVKLYGTLRDHLPAETKGKSVIKLAEGATIDELVTMLGIDHDVLTAINGKHQSTNTAVLKEGDAVTVFEMTAGG